LLEFARAQHQLTGELDRALATTEKAMRFFRETDDTFSQAEAHTSSPASFAGLPRNARTAGPGTRHVSTPAILSSTRQAHHHHVKPAGGSTGQRANRVFDRRICPVRSASMAGRRQGPAGVDVSVPNVARMYDYWLGGKDNFAADREAAGRSVELVPQLPWLARENRGFLGRAVRFCADAGITQFLDIGSGLPTSQNVHQVAEQVIADPRVVYVDNDPVVVSHAQALLATPHTTAVQGDLTRPGEILDDPEIRRLIDLSKPACLLLVAILHYIPDDFDTYGCVARLREAMAPGSYLVITHSEVSPAHVAGDEPLSETARELKEVLEQTPLGPVRNREEIAAYFGDLTLAEPGLVNVWDWRPDSEVVVNPSDFLTVLAGVARKD
jgi:hypothetical protein